jgi:hypothetical protein
LTECIKPICPNLSWILLLSDVESKWPDSLISMRSFDRRYDN